MQKIEDNFLKIKDEFEVAFVRLLLREYSFKCFINSTYKQKIDTYVVGGFLRDALIRKESRDIDIIININIKELIDLINTHNLKFTINRLNGIKIILNSTEVDIWTLEHNWAFKNDVINRNDNYILESIASGCFYNFDALVINTRSLEFNIRYFSKMIEKNKLDILKKRVIYKSRNPTIEANILRAFYIRKKYHLDYSQNCNEYLVSRILHLESSFGSATDRLFVYLHKYPKYREVISYSDIKDMIIYCKRNFTGQLWIDFDSDKTDPIL